MSTEPQGQFCTIEPGKFLGKILPGDGTQNRIMGTLRVVNDEIIPAYRNVSLAPDKLPEDFRGVAILKTPELLSQPTVNG
ncbi:MAG: hypothetical protein AB1461_14725, partial [Thermodesulfobacteriota bacterium]